MSAEVPPQDVSTSLPDKANVPATGTPSFGAVILAGIADGLGTLTAAQNANLSAFLSGIITPIVRQEVQDAFKLFQDKAVLSKGNDALQTLDRL